MIYAQKTNQDRPGTWVYGIQGGFKSGIPYVSAKIGVFGM